MKQRFVHNVQVYSPTGDLVRRVTPGVAAYLIRCGSQIRRRNAGRVSEITLGSTLGRPVGPVSSARLTQYMGQKYTERQALTDGKEVVGHCVRFRKIHRDDQVLFMLSVIDCGGIVLRRSEPQRRGAERP